MGNSSVSKNIYIYLVSILVLTEFQVLNSEAVTLFWSIRLFWFIMFQMLFSSQISVCSLNLKRKIKNSVILFFTLCFSTSMGRLTLTSTKQTVPDEVLSLTEKLQKVFSWGTELRPFLTGQRGSGGSSRSLGWTLRLHRAKPRSTRSREGLGAVSPVMFITHILLGSGNEDFVSELNGTEES